MSADPDLDRLRSELKAALEYAAHLEECIRPFAAFADTFRSTPPGPYLMDDHVLFHRNSLNTGEERQLTAGDFRSAYAWASGTPYLRNLKHDLVRATVEQIRQIAKESSFDLNPDVEWRVLSAVLGDEA